MHHARSAADLLPKPQKKKTISQNKLSAVIIDHLNWFCQSQIGLRPRPRLKDNRTGIKIGWILFLPHATKNHSASGDKWYLSARGVNSRAFCVMLQLHSSPWLSPSSESLPARCTPNSTSLILLLIFCIPAGDPYAESSHLILFMRFLVLCVRGKERGAMRIIIMAYRVINFSRARAISKSSHFYTFGPTNQTARTFVRAFLWIPNLVGEFLIKIMTFFDLGVLLTEVSKEHAAGTAVELGKKADNWIKEFLFTKTLHARN